MVAASSHMETKRGIDYMQIHIAKKDLVIVGRCGRHYALYTFLYRPKSKLLHIDMEQAVQHNRQLMVYSS